MSRDANPPIGLPPAAKPGLAVFLPREHGSWALVLEPMVLALLAAPSLRGLALAIAATALFLTRRPWQCLAQGKDVERARVARWLVSAGLLVATVAAIWALAGQLRAVAIPLACGAVSALVFAGLEARRQARSLTAECAGALAFCALASAVVLVDPDRAGDAWLAGVVGSFAAARALTSLLSIRTFLRRRKGREASGSPAVAVALLAVAASAWFMLTRGGSAVLLAWTIAFAARAAWLVGTWAPSWSARRIGFMEFGLGLAAVLTTGLSLS